MDEHQVRSYVERMRAREGVWRRVRLGLFALVVMATVALLTLAIEYARELRHLA